MKRRDDLHDLYTFEKKQMHIELEKDDTSEKQYE